MPHLALWHRFLPGLRVRRHHTSSSRYAARFARWPLSIQTPADPLLCSPIQGYVHGDVKSSNVLLCGNGCAKLADIAFSRHVAPPELESFDSFGFEPPPLARTFAW